MATVKQIVFLTRDQSFEINVSGLLPLSYHYFYRERGLVDSSLLKPVGGKLGDPLITDDNGTLTFTYYYDSGITTDVPSEVEEANRQAASVATVKELVLTNINADTLPANFESASLSYWIGHIEVQVKMPADNEFEDKTTPPAPSGGGGDSSSFLGTGWFSTGSFFDW
jgi:hypothetical protein